MSKRKILHMITPARNVSAFDVNMAVDAGYQIIVPHAGLSVEDVPSLVQDAIFSRPPKSAASTGLFIGGYDVNQAADMFEAARKSQVPPFEMAIFVDPNGAYTTAAALIAVIENRLSQIDGNGLEGRTVKIFGGGPVGMCAAVLASERGARASLVRLTASARSDTVEKFSARYGRQLPSVSAIDPAARKEAVSDAEVIISSAKAGVQVLDRCAIEHARRLLVAADVNAVPPSGIEGVSVTDTGTEVEMPWGTFTAIGALGVGSVKYKVQHQLFKQMLNSEDAVTIDFPDAFSEAVEHVG